MQTIEDILNAARHLSNDERRRLMDALQAHKAPTEQQRHEALSSWQNLAGTIHADFTDVSTEKYTHLADIYTDRQ